MLKLPKLDASLAPLAAALLLLLGSRYIPDVLIRYTAGTMVGSAALLALIVVAIRKDKVLGLAVMMAVAALFLEQRRRVVGRILRGSADELQERPGGAGEGGRPASTLVERETHPSIEEPNVEEHPFKPEEDKDGAAGEQHDEKHPLETAGQDTEHIADVLTQKGLA